MPRKRVVWLLALVTVILVVAAAVSLVRRGFSARDQPSLVESYVARTARGSRRSRRMPRVELDKFAGGRATITGNLSDGKLTIESVTGAKKATPRNHSES